MNAETRAALVEELAEAMWDGEFDDDDWPAGVERPSFDMQSDAYQVPLRNYATRSLPIIDRLLAERDIDAMLNAVHPEATLMSLAPKSGLNHSNENWAKVAWPAVGKDYIFEVVEAYGPDRTAAIADACRKARSAQEAP